MKAKISFLALVCLAFALMLALPSLAGMWRDDFEDGDYDGWWQSAGTPGKWVVEDGEVSGEVTGNVSGELVTGKPKWRDYTIECKIKFLGGGMRYGGMVARYQDTIRSYWFFLLVGVGAQGGLSTVGPLEVKQAQQFPVEFGTWYKLKLEVDKNDFKFYVGDKLLIEFNDNTFDSGLVGLFVIDAHVHFDDVIITGPEIPDGGYWDPAKHPGEKAVEPKGKLAATWGEIKRSR
ncbi:DUF1080 domain-containing protein [Candidatus Poribacteria bacterium]|nr:DUF1080 domain-containing protein [Candidatus Poribacteria bacterium]